MGGGEVEEVFTVVHRGEGGGRLAGDKGPGVAGDQCLCEGGGKEVRGMGRCRCKWMRLWESAEGCLGRRADT